MCDVVQRLTHSRVGSLGPGDRACQELSGDVVASFRQADLYGEFGAAVQLRRSAGAGTASARRSAVLGLEQAFLYETIQVELGDMVGDADTGRRLLSADRRMFADDETVESPAHRFSETGDAVEPGIEIWSHVVFHGRFDLASTGNNSLPDTRFDETRHPV
jgi:hypothetical protein